MQRYLVALRCLPCQRERLHSVTSLGSGFASAHGLVSKPREVFAEWAALMRMNQAAQAHTRQDRVEKPMPAQSPYG